MEKHVLQAVHNKRAEGLARLCAHMLDKHAAMLVATKSNDAEDRFSRTGCQRTSLAQGVRESWQWCALDAQKATRFGGRG